MKDRIFKVFLITAVLISLAACDNQFEGFTKGESMMTFTTMNLRLGDELPFYDERTAVKLDVLSEADADVICIQELYYSKDILKVKDFFEKDLKYNKPLWLITNEDDFEPIPPACTQEDVAPIISCYMENCMVEGAAQTCILTECGTIFLTLPQVCQTCLLGQGIGAIAGGDIQSVLQGCMTETKFDYNYDGNNGILLVSRYPMKDKGSLALTSYGNYRMAIYATVQTSLSKPGIGDVQVICTGLSKLSDAEYGGLAGGWAQEQMTQVSEILDIPVKDEISQRVIMGDFDSNIAGGYNIKESNAAPVSAIISAGYYDPYFDISEDDELPCTICAENPMVETGADSVPDHIFFLNKRGFLYETKRTFINEFIKFENNKKERYSLSDHYGMTVKMTADPNF